MKWKQKKSFITSFWLFKGNVGWSWIRMKWKQKKSFITSFWLFKGNGFLRIVVGDWTTLNDNFYFSIFVILRSLISWMFSVTPDSLPIHPQSWYKLDGLFKVNI